MKKKVLEPDYEEDNLFIPCDCHAEGILVTEWIDKYEDDNCRQEFWFAFFGYGHYHSKPNIWQRLKYAWWHIRTGKHYADEVILRRSEIKKLIKYLQEKIDKFEELKRILKIRRSLNYREKNSLKLLKKEMIIINKKTNEYFVEWNKKHPKQMFSSDYKKAEHLKRRLCSKFIDMLIKLGYDVEIGNEK